VLKGEVPGRLPTDSERLVDVRYSGLYYLARKITRCISHTPTDSVRLVDVRYSVFLLSIFIAQATLNGTRPNSPACVEPARPLDIRFCISWPKKQCAYHAHTQTHTDLSRTVAPTWSDAFVFFVNVYRLYLVSWSSWSMCDIFFCNSCPEKSQGAYRTSCLITNNWSMYDIRPRNV
jgi:hypothetical protein